MRYLLLAASVLLAADAGAAAADLGTPRRALRFFLDSAQARDFAAAAEALDLRDLPKQRWASVGPDLARKLKLVLDQQRGLDWDKVSDDPTGAPADRNGTEVAGMIPLGAAQIPLRLVRSPDGAWRIARGVVAAIPQLYDAYGPGWVGEHLPAVLTDLDFLGLAAWQWLGLALGLGLALFVGLGLGALTHRLALWIVRRTRFTWDDKLVEAASGPVHLVMGLAAFAAVVPHLHLAAPAHGTVDLLLRIAAVVAFCWCGLRAIRFATDVLTERLLHQGDGASARSHLTQVMALGRMAGIVVVVLSAALVLLQFDALRTLGASLLASAGVAGIVIGLAAQRPIATLLASLQVSLARPIRIGDVVVIENEWGTIEEITLTYVVVKIWDLRRLVVPMTKILDAPFQNWTRAGSDLIGTVFLYTDYRIPVDEVRRELERFVAGRSDWDRRVAILQVTNMSDKAVELRALVSASSASVAWDLRCAVREHLLAFIQQLSHGAFLPRTRFESPPQSTMPVQTPELGPARRAENR